MRMLRELPDVLRETLEAWKADGAMQWGAALAYYAILSLPPLVLILLLLVGQVYGDAAAREELVRWTSRFFGEEGMGLVRTVVDNAPDSRSAVGVGSVLFLLVVATGVFAQLHRAMNHIWGVRWQGGGLKTFLRGRLLGFFVVLALGGLLALAVALSAVASFFALHAGRMVPGASLALVVGNLLVTFGLVTLLFATFFRVLPDVRIAWRDVWTGAAVSAFLFLVGNTVLGAYLGASEIGSAYGAAGSLLGVLVWVYYSAQVYFFGAEFTQVWSSRYGGKIEPARGAVYRAE